MNVYIFSLDPFAKILPFLLILTLLGRPRSRSGLAIEKTLHCTSGQWSRLNFLRGLHWRNFWWFPRYFLDGCSSLFHHCRRLVRCFGEGWAFLVSSICRLPLVANLLPRLFVSFMIWQQIEILYLPISEVLYLTRNSLLRLHFWKCANIIRYGGAQNRADLEVQALR